MTDSPLTDLQVEVLRLFFRLEESNGFALAGGAALVAVGLSQRPTEDLDLFASHASVTSAADALCKALTALSWGIETIHATERFRRMAVTTPDGRSVLVDLARDAGPLDIPTVTAYGPTYPPRELAARKLLALFDRAALRDFIDVHTVSLTFETDELLAVARQIDDGFDQSVLRQMINMLDRYSDDEIREYGANPTALRRFFASAFR